MAKAKRVVLLDAESGKELRYFDKQSDARDFLGFSNGGLYTAIRLRRVFKFKSRKCMVMEQAVYLHERKHNPEMFRKDIEIDRYRPINSAPYLDKSVAEVCLNCTRKECDASSCGCRAYTNAVRAVRYGIA